MLKGKVLKFSAEVLEISLDGEMVTAGSGSIKLQQNATFDVKRGLLKASDLNMTPAGPTFSIKLAE